MLTYNIETGGNVPKYLQLYEFLKRDILNGTVKSGEKLPSKRSMAEHNGISILTVLNAYQLLIDEGYVSTKERSGYYVSLQGGMVPEEKPVPPGSGHSEGPDKYSCDPAQNGSSVVTDSGCFIRNNISSLSSGPAGQAAGSDCNTQDGKNMTHPENMVQAASPNYSTQGGGKFLSIEENFPFSEYKKVMRSVLTNHNETLLEKSPSFGSDIFRRAIADYLRRYRGIEVRKEQVVIGSGSEYLYGLLVTFLGRKQVYGLEDPSYEKIRQVYEINGATCEMLPMDENGISRTALENTKATVLHVTPFHSYPTGITADASKRFEYLTWAAKHGGLIIEDDIDSEFAVGSKPVETIFSMDGGRKVIYMNTFSRSITPAVRVAYMVLPPAMAAEFEKKLSFFSCTVPTFDQYVLAEFINEGYFERHLNRLRRKLKD